MTSRRGSLSFSKGLSYYASKQRIGIHPGLLLECREAPRGLGLYLTDSVDAGTALLVVPGAVTITSASFRTSCPLFPRELTRGLLHQHSSLADAVGQCTLLNSLLPSGNEEPDWLALAWGLALARTQQTTHYWGWLDSLPTLEDYTQAWRECVTSAKTKKGEKAGAQLHSHMQHLRQETQLVYDTMSKFAPIPPPSVFVWAVHTVLSRAQLVTTFPGQASLGFIPYVDFANHCNSSTPSSGTDAAGSSGRIDLMPFNPALQFKSGRLEGSPELLHRAERLPSWYHDEVELISFRPPALHTENQPRSCDLLQSVSSAPPKQISQLDDEVNPVETAVRPQVYEPNTAEVIRSHNVWWTGHDAHNVPLEERSYFVLSAASALRSNSEITLDYSQAGSSSVAPDDWLCLALRYGFVE